MVAALDHPKATAMNRVIVARSIFEHGWDVICPTCRTNDWTPTARFRHWPDAILEANYHARTCPQRTTP